MTEHFVLNFQISSHILAWWYITQFIYRYTTTSKIHFRDNNCNLNKGQHKGYWIYTIFVSMMYYQIELHSTNTHKDFKCFLNEKRNNWLSFLIIITSKYNSGLVENCMVLIILKWHKFCTYFGASDSNSSKNKMHGLALWALKWKYIFPF